MKQAVRFIDNLETEPPDCRRALKPKNVKVTVCILTDSPSFTLHVTGKKEEKSQLKDI